MQGYAFEDYVQGKGIQLSIIYKQMKCCGCVYTHECVYLYADNYPAIVGAVNII